MGICFRSGGPAAGDEFHTPVGAGRRERRERSGQTHTPSRRCCRLGRPVGDGWPHAEVDQS